MSFLVTGAPFSSLHGALLGTFGALLGFLSVPRRSKAPQSVPRRPRAFHNVPGRPRACQIRSKESQNVPGRPGVSQNLPGPPETSQGVPGRSGARVGHSAQCADAPVWEWCTNWRRSGSKKKKPQKKKNTSSAGGSLPSEGPACFFEEPTQEFMILDLKS